MKLEDFLKGKYPEMDRKILKMGFWSYYISGPHSMEDEMAISISVQYGKVRKIEEDIITITIPFTPTGIKVETEKFPAIHEEPFSPPKAY